MYWLALCANVSEKSFGGPLGLRMLYPCWWKEDRVRASDVAANTRALFLAGRLRVCGGASVGLSWLPVAIVDVGLSRSEHGEQRLMMTGTA